MGYPELPEADFFVFQHEETGLIQCVDGQQVEWGFETNNPRLNKVGGLWTESSVHVAIDVALSIHTQWHNMESVPRNKPVLLAISVSSGGRGYKWEMQVCEIRDDGRVCDAIHGDNAGWDFDDYQGWQELPASPPPETDE